MTSQVESFGDVVRKLRLERGLSQSELAARAEMLPSQLCKLERGRSDVTASTLRRIASALDVSASALLDGEASGPRNNSKAGAGRAVGVGDYERTISGPEPGRDVAAVLAKVAAAERKLAAAERAAGVESATALQLSYPYGVDERAAALMARDFRFSLGLGRMPAADLECALELAAVPVMRLPMPFASIAFYNRSRNTLSIALKEGDTPERHRYRLAYELGGAALYASSGWRTVADDGAAHRFVRNFVAAFLMPEETVRAAVARLGIGPRDWTMDALVFVKERFFVSAESFALRLETLGLVTPSIRTALRDELRARYVSHPNDMEPHPPKEQMVSDVVKRVARGRKK